MYKQKAGSETEQLDSTGHPKDMRVLNLCAMALALKFLVFEAERIAEMLMKCSPPYEMLKEEVLTSASFREKENGTKMETQDLTPK